MPSTPCAGCGPNGEIKWGGDLIFVSEALVGEPVGVAETGDWIVRFADHPLGIIDRRRKLRPFAPARPGRRKGHREQIGKTVNHLSGP